MTIRKDAQGRRSVAAEVEVPGTPEQVWEAIATSGGMSAWFVPTVSEEREGGRTVSSFGPGMDAVGRITAWQPPQRMVVASEDSGDGTGPREVATEWIVEARSGGRCVVRVVHRWFADSDDWDGEFEGHAYGWVSSFFRMLRLYLADFSAQPCCSIDLSAFSRSTPKATWAHIQQALRIDPSDRRFVSSEDAPELSGRQESTEVTDPELLAARERAPQVVAALQGMDGEDPQLLLRLDHPVPGMAHFFIMDLGGQTMVTMRFFLYGDQAAQAASSLQQAWRAWLDARFSPMPLE